MVQSPSGQLFRNGEVVYRGYVDDPRNTDNAWMETTAFHFHCTDKLARLLKLEAGDVRPCLLHCATFHTS